MAYKVIKGKNKIRGEQTFVDTISGSVISASSYIGNTFNGVTISASLGLFTSLTASIISASTYLGIADPTPKGPEYSLQFNSGSAFSGSSTLIFNYTTNTLSGTYAQFTNITASYISGNITNAQTASKLVGFDQNNYLLTSSFNSFTASYNTGSFSGSFTGSFSGSFTGSFSGTSSYAQNADLLDGRDSTTFAGLTTNTFIGDQTITGNVNISGIVTANELHITYTTSSVVYTSGSTKFGDSADDTHQFTGSIFAGIVSGTNATFNSFTGSLFGTSSYASLAATASYYNTSSLLTTASVSNATITFTKGNGSTFPLTINNVANAQTASYVLNAVSASYATNGFPFSGSAVVTGTLTITGSAGTTVFYSAADTVILTGSLYATGSIILTGTLNVSGAITGNLFGTSSFATNCLTASYIDGGFY